MTDSLQHTTFSTIRNLSNLISTGTLSPVDLIEASLDRIKKFNSELNAFITVLEESARRDAKTAESMIKNGKYLGPLHGIPISLKDLIYVNGVRSTSGSKILSDFVPNYDSTVIKRLKNAGAILIGMNNTHEFACGITNINPHYGSSKNPWDFKRMSGGSSGGSAVSVSAGMSAASIGTDTSGSIRVPSSLCGLFGLKPTYGRVSKYGVMQLAPSMDHIGPITRSAWDIAAVLQVIAGHDPMDKTTSDKPVPSYLDALASEKAGKKFKVAIPNPYFFDLIDSKVVNSFEKFVDKLQSYGIESTHVQLEETDKIFDTWRSIRLGESATTHKEWIKTRRDEYDPQVLSMLDEGSTITAIQYLTALKTMDVLRNAFLRAMKDYDALLVPTTIITAPLLDQQFTKIEGEEITTYKALSRQTIGFSATGLPALNVPMGLTDDKLPIGAQLIGKPFDEETLLKIAYSYEQQSGISDKMIPPHCR